MNSTVFFAIRLSSYALFVRTCRVLLASGIMPLEDAMKSLKQQIKIDRPKREPINREEASKRVKAFPKRKEKLIAAIRKDTH